MKFVVCSYVAVRICSLVKITLLCLFVTGGEGHCGGSIISIIRKELTCSNGWVHVHGFKVHREDRSWRLGDQFVVIRLQYNVRPSFTYIICVVIPFFKHYTESMIKGWLHLFQLGSTFSTVLACNNIVTTRICAVVRARLSNNHKLSGRHTGYIINNLPGSAYLFERHKTVWSKNGIKMTANPSIVNIHPDFLSNFDLQLQQLVDEKKILAQWFWKLVNHFSSFLNQKVRNVLIPASSLMYIWS